MLGALLVVCSIENILKATTPPPVLIWHSSRTPPPPPLRGTSGYKKQKVLQNF